MQEKKKMKKMVYLILLRHPLIERSLYLPLVLLVVCPHHYVDVRDVIAYMELSIILYYIILYYTGYKNDFFHLPSKQVHTCLARILRINRRGREGKGEEEGGRRDRVKTKQKKKTGSDDKTKD